MSDERSVIKRRLYQACVAHEASLASLNSVDVAASMSLAHSSDNVSGHDRKIKAENAPFIDVGVEALLCPAAERSACSALEGEGEEVSAICLNPAEMVPPHRLLAMDLSVSICLTT